MGHAYDGVTWGDMYIQGRYSGDIARNLVLQGAGGKVGIGVSPSVPLDLLAGSANTLNDLATFQQSATNTSTGLRFQQVSNGSNWGYYHFGIMGPGTVMDTSGGITYDSADTASDRAVGIIFDGSEGDTYFLGNKSAYTGTTKTLASVSRMTIDGSTGNVGVGVTPTAKFHVSDGTGVWKCNSNSTNPYFSVDNGTITTIMGAQSSGSQGAVGTQSNHDLDLVTNDTTRVTIDTSGDTNFMGDLTVAHSGASSVIEASNAGDYHPQVVLTRTGGSSYTNRSWKTWLNNTGEFVIRDETGAADRLTIDTSGNVAFNAYGAGTLSTDSSGNITASSDLALKNTVEYFDDQKTDSLSKVNQLRPCRYKFNSDPYKTYEGFIAQDVETVLPDAIDGKKHKFYPLLDADGAVQFDADGAMILDETKPRYRTLNTTNITAHLVKGMQELSAQLESARATITTLEGGLVAPRVEVGLTDPCETTDGPIICALAGGFVRVGGIVSLNGAASGSLICTLPVSHRPARDEIFLAPVQQGTAELQVGTDGTIIAHFTGTPAWLSLSVISFITK
jgi:hypothetical protein